MSSDSPIIVIDSGLGGLTVARALRRLLPYEDIIYFGDTARVPYGSKTGPTILSFVRQIIRFLRPFDAKHTILACNTATALALHSIKKEFEDLSISGVIEPGARAAAQAARAKHFPVIGVIGTEATIRARAYEAAILRRRQHARIYCHATPLLAPIIEEGRDAADPLVQLALRQYLEPLIKCGTEVLVLGCTHYPMLKAPIAAIMGEAVQVIDSADQCAENVAHRLLTAGTLRGGTRQLGRMRCFVTDDSPRFAQTASRFLGFDIPRPQWVAPEELYRTDAGVTLPDMLAA